MREGFGLRTEILVQLVLLMAAALLFVGFLLLTITEQALLAEKEHSIIETTEVLTRNLSRIQNAFSEEWNREAVLQINSFVSPMRSLVAWGIYDDKLSPILVSDPDESLSPRPVMLASARLDHEPQVRRFYSSTLLWGKKSEKFFELAVPLQNGQRVNGLVLARHSLVDLDQRLYKGRNLILAYAAGYGLLLTGFGIFLLNRTVVRPVQRLQVATETVASGELEGQIPTDGPREIANLANAFNRMTDALRQSRLKTEETILELKQANGDLRSAQHEVVQAAKLASVGHLAAGMAHEIGNPLGAVIGYLELLRQMTDDAGAKDLIQRSLAETSRIDRLIRELLDYSRPGSGDVAVHDPAEIVREVAALLQHQGSLENRTVQIDQATDLPGVKCERDKMFQVLINLLLNAVDATDQGGRIRISSRAASGRVQVNIEDDGCGMSPDVQQHLFDPFFTTKAPDRGRGLGLAVCHRIIEELGGKILVESTEGEGTAFTLDLPAHQAEV